MSIDVEGEVVLDPGRLRSLVALHEWGTVTAAAEALGYSPSAVSQQLATLGRDVGLDLLESRGRTVALTPAARALVDAAGGVFDELERAEAAARRAADLRKGTVRVGALGSTIIDLVPLAVSTLAAEAPDLSLEVVDLGDDVLAALRQRRVEIAIDHHWSSVPARDLRGLDVVELCREPIFVIAADDLDLSDPDVRRGATWVDHPCDQCGPAVREVIATLGDADPHLPFTTDDMTVMLHVAALGAAMTVVPGLAGLHLPDGVRAWRVAGVTRSIAAHVRTSTGDDPRLTTLSEHLQAAGEVLQARFADVDATDLDGGTSARG